MNYKEPTTRVMVEAVDNPKKVNKGKTKRQPNAFEMPCNKCGVFIDLRLDGYGWDPDKGYLCVPCWTEERGRHEN
jgi:hypothetical protein